MDTSEKTDPSQIGVEGAQDETALVKYDRRVHHKSNAVGKFMGFLRIAGLAHILFGLYVWFYLIGGYQSNMPFLSLTFVVQVEIIFISVISFVAGLGLWLLTPWGVTLWIFQAVMIIVTNIFNENPLISLSIFSMIQIISLLYYMILRRKYESFVEEFGHIQGM